MKRLLIAAASLLLLAGCSDDSLLNSGTGVVLTTVGNSFTAPDEVDFLLQNGTSATLQLPACDGDLVVIAERMQAGAWSPVANSPCPDEFSDAPATLNPGGRAGGSKLILTPGQYRLRIVFTATGSEGTTFQVVSNEFAVN